MVDFDDRQGEGATERALFKRYQDGQIDAVKRNMVELFSKENVIDELRRIIQQYILPGRGSIRATQIAEEISTRALFINDQIDSERIENFSNNTIICPKQKEDLFEYARYLVTDVENLSKNMRPAVTWAIEKCLFPVIDAYRAAVKAENLLEFGDRQSLARLSLGNVFMYKELFSSMSGNQDTLSQFATKVIGYPECDVASFIMLRHTAKPKRLYRSYYQITVTPISLSRGLGGPEPVPGQFLMVDFTAKGRGRGGTVNSVGYVIAQESTVYFIGNIDGRGITVFSLPKGQFQNWQDQPMSGLIMSKDLAGEVEDMPLVARALLVNVTTEIERILKEHGDAQTSQETIILEQIFGNDEQILHKMSNAVKMDLSTELSMKDGTSCRSYENFLKRSEATLGAALKDLVELPEGLAQQLFLPPQLRGVTALTLDGRTGG